MNKVFLTGRLVQKPQLFEGKDDTKVVGLTLAVNSRRNKEQQTDFVRVSFIGKIVDFILTMDKGDLLEVEGHVRVTTQVVDGKMLSTIRVNGERINFYQKYRKLEDAKEAETKK